MSSSETISTTEVPDLPTSSLTTTPTPTSTATTAATSLPLPSPTKESKRSQVRRSLGGRARPSLTPADTAAAPPSSSSSSSATTTTTTTNEQADTLPPFPTTTTASSTIAPTASTSTAAASATAAAAAAALSAPSYSSGLESRRLYALRAAFAHYLSRAFPARDIAHTLSRSTHLADDFRTKFQLTILSLAEKATDSVQRNIMSEFDLLLSEHNLSSKLAELEGLTEQQNPFLLDPENTAEESTSYPSASPEQTIKALILEARRVEKERLLNLIQEREAENALLDAEYTTLHSEIQPIKEKLIAQQKSIQHIYETIHSTK